MARHGRVFPLNRFVYEQPSAFVFPAVSCPPGQPTSPYTSGFVPIPSVPNRVSFDEAGLDRWANQVAQVLDLLRGKLVKLTPVDGTPEYMISNTTGTANGLTIVSKSADYAASAGDFVVMDVEDDSRTVTLPASPSADDRIGFYVKDPNSAGNTLIVDRNGNDIGYLNSNLEYSGDGKKAVLQYDSTNGSWVLISGERGV